MVIPIAFRSAEQLSAIIDSVPTAIVMVDESGKITLINRQAERLFGYTSLELLGEPIDILVPCRFRAGHPELRSNFIKNPKTRSMGVGRDLFGLRKDGSEFPVEIGLNPINTDEGLFIVSAIVDISERKRLEARFQATVESAPMAMLMIDQVGKIVLVNAEVERLFGYEREELLHQKMEVLIPTRYRSGHSSLRAQYFSAPKARRMGMGRDLFGLCKNGSEFPIEIGLNPVQTDEGLFVLSAIVDVSERLKQAEALRHANEVLERSNIELQRFVYIASHDLQTPMRSIASFAELLQMTYDDKLDEQGKDWTRRINQSIHVLQDLVRDLLQYSRVDSELRSFDKVSMREVFDSAVSLLDVAIRESKAKVSCGDLPIINGDRSQLVQLMLNLIANALKYRAATPPDIRISVEHVNHEWVFAVNDNGIGIEPRHYERIFEIFKRLHDQRKYSGSGIGLAVCRRVVHHHGGKIWVESEIGQGSIFYFTLPEATAEKVGE